MTISDVFKVLQCGDPNGERPGGPGYSIPAEYDGTETYPRRDAGHGARLRTPTAAVPQFFIVLSATPPLDPAYTTFGTVDQATNRRDHSRAAKVRHHAGARS